MASNKQFLPTPSHSISTWVTELREWNPRKYEQVWNYLQEIVDLGELPPGIESYIDCLNTDCPCRGELVGILKQNCDASARGLDDVFSHHGLAILDLFGELLQVQPTLESLASLSELERNTDTYKLLGKVVTGAMKWHGGEKHYKAIVDLYTLDDMYVRLRHESRIDDILDEVAIDNKALLSRATPVDDIPSLPGQYLGIMTQKDDEDWCRKYVGQSSAVGRRLFVHDKDRKRQDKTLPLFHQIWNKEGRQVSWVLLSTVASVSDESDEIGAAWLSLGEMFYALRFQTLQAKDLQVWGLQGEEGLNVRSPLHQGSSFRGPDGGFGSLFKSSDPEVLQIAHGHMKMMSDKGLAAAQTPSTISKRSKAISNKKGNPNIRPWQEGDPSQIIVRCNGCKDPASEHVDLNPRFHIKTSRYVANQGVCQNREKPCQPTPSMVKQGFKSKVTNHTPMNLLADQWVTMAALYKKDPDFKTKKV